jgi:hypothetical protein
MAVTHSHSLVPPEHGLATFQRCFDRSVAFHDAALQTGRELHVATKFDCLDTVVGLDILALNIGAVIDLDEYVEKCIPLIDRYKALE